MKLNTRFCSHTSGAQQTHMTHYYCPSHREWSTPLLPKALLGSAILYPLALCKFFYIECERKKDILNLGGKKTGFGFFFSHPISFNSYFLTLQKQQKLCCCLIAKPCPTFFNPMNCSTPSFSVLHYLPEFAQTHVH